MNRKKFLLGIGLSALSVSIFGSLSKDSLEGKPSECETTRDILGPFYREDAPTRSDLVLPGKKGNIIEIQGKVYKGDCKTPLKNAMVEIWHCDTEGWYDNETPEYLHRGAQETNSKGNYRFKTIFPGKYLNGGLYRPAHIHFRVRAEGYQELISQIYFQGDPQIAEDPWASQPKAQKRLLDLIPSGVEGGLSVNFDIYLPSA